MISKKSVNRVCHLGGMSVIVRYAADIPRCLRQVENNRFFYTGACNFRSGPKREREMVSRKQVASEEGLIYVL